jgi:hypothetical protein
MKTRFRFVAAITLPVSLILNAQFSTVLAQGSLTPPSPPAPVMKSLDQIEPRIPVDAVHTPGNSQSVFVISRPGSYYLTTNLLAPPTLSGITFRTNDITLDLNGFALVGGGSGGNGVATPVNLTNLVVRNGTIRNFQIGIDTTGNRHSLIENVLVTQNGHGITLGAYSTARSCKALANTSGSGISTENDSLVVGCMTSGCFNGIVVGNDSVVEDCAAQNNQNYGILVAGNNARIDGNHCVGNNYGIYVGSFNVNNVIVRNSLIANTNDISVPVGNKVGPLVSDPTSSSANAWANIITSLIF